MTKSVLTLLLFTVALQACGKKDEEAAVAAASASAKAAEAEAARKVAEETAAREKAKAEEAAVVQARVASKASLQKDADAAGRKVYYFAEKVAKLAAAKKRTAETSLEEVQGKLKTLRTDLEKADPSDAAGFDGALTSARTELQSLTAAMDAFEPLVTGKATH